MVRFWGFINYFRELVTPLLVGLKENRKESRKEKHHVVFVFVFGGVVSKKRMLRPTDERLKIEETQKGAKILEGRSFEKPPYYVGSLLLLLLR